MRSALVAALVARADSSLRARVRRFVRGLSCDELQFIASFLGACILESTGQPHQATTRHSEQVLQNVTSRCSEDQDLKMILLLEYLYRSRAGQSSMPLRSNARMS